MTSIQKRPRRAIRRRAALAAAATVATLGLVLTACAPSGDGGGDGGSSTGDNTFVMAQSTLPATLDPHNFSGGTRQYFSVLNSMLVNYGGDSCQEAPDAVDLKGILAESWEWSEDRKTITVTLRETESQYGNPLTSDDIIWTLERGRELSPIVTALSTSLTQLDEAEPITKIDDRTFEFNFVGTTPMDLAMWAVPTFTILDSVEAQKHATDDDPWATEWVQQNSATFGPWEVTSFIDGDVINLAPNEGYVGERGNIDTLAIKQVASAADQLGLIQSGSIDYARELTWPQLGTLEGAANVDLYSCFGVSRDLLLLNQGASEAFNDIRVREAISMALDRNALVEGAYAGLATPSEYGLVHSVLPDGKATDVLVDNDPDGARTLLADAGYPDGFSFVLEYNEIQPGAQVAQLGVLIQSQLAEIGVTVELAPLTSGNELQENHNTGNYEAQLWSSSAALPSASFEAALLRPGSPNAAWWGDNDSPEFMELYGAINASEVGTSEYDDAVTAFADFVNQQFLVVNLVETPNVFAMSTRTKDLDKALGPIMIRPDAAQLNVE